MYKSVYNTETILAIRHEAEEQRAAYLLSLGRRIMRGVATLFHMRKGGGALANH